MRPYQLGEKAIAVLGIPCDEHSSYLRGPAQAPTHIRQALNDGASNLCAENGLDLSTEERFIDLGDLAFEQPDSHFAEITAALDRLLDQGARVISLGGDHAISYPILKAYARYYPQLSILHLDAHPDLYDQFDGDPLSHASPFARIMEEKLASQLTQIGIRTLNPHQRDQAKRFNVNIIEARQWQPDLLLPDHGQIYLSIDMDVLDPAFAPGVSHHEPGGLSTRAVLQIIQNMPGQIVGADIVELNPLRDPLGITAKTAAKFLKEIAAQMVHLWGSV